MAAASAEWLRFAGGVPERFALLHWITTTASMCSGAMCAQKVSIAITTSPLAHCAEKISLFPSCSLLGRLWNHFLEYRMGLSHRQTNFLFRVASAESQGVHESPEGAANVLREGKASRSPLPAPDARVPR